MRGLKNGRHSREANAIESGAKRSRPSLHQHSVEIQPYGRIAKLPIALDENVCASSIANLNQLLADTMTLRDLYKKHHWQAAGATFYQLHLLFDKHHDEQSELVDAVAERIQLLGGVSICGAENHDAEIFRSPTIVCGGVNQQHGAHQSGVPMERGTFIVCTSNVPSRKNGIGSRLCTAAAKSNLPACTHPDVVLPVIKEA